MCRTYRNNPRWEDGSLMWVIDYGISAYTGKHHTYARFNTVCIDDGKSRDGQYNRRSSHIDKRIGNKRYRAKIKQALYHGKEYPKRMWYWDSYY